MNNYADEIKERVPLLDLLAYYGFHPSYNRIPCPFHNGKDRNMLASKNMYKCFVCGERGDAIDFVRRYFGLDFNGACAKINDDFGLGLPIGRRLSQAEQQGAEMRNAERQRKIEAERQRKAALRAAYEKALDEFSACDVILARCAPISPATGFSEAFCWAVKNIDRAWYDLKKAEADMYEYRREKAG